MAFIAFPCLRTNAGGKTDLSGPDVSNEGDEQILVRETPFDRPDDIIVEACDLDDYLNMF